MFTVRNDTGTVTDLFLWGEIHILHVISVAAGIRSLLDSCIDMLNKVNCKIILSCLVRD